MALPPRIRFTCSFTNWSHPIWLYYSKHSYVNEIHIAIFFSMLSHFSPRMSTNASRKIAADASRYGNNPLVYPKNIPRNITINSRKLVTLTHVIAIVTIHAQLICTITTRYRQTSWHHILIGICWTSSNFRHSIISSSHTAVISNL